MNSDPKFGFRLGEWQAYPLRNLLVGPPGEVHIEPKVMQVLEQLAANAGEVVERDHLLETLWGGRAMSDEPLTRCIATLRRVLDDSPKEPRFIQTIPKHGLADELSNQLTKVRGVRVAARTSAFAFKGENKDITEIARQLRVAFILTGSVRQADDQLRIAVQLTEASSGFNVWSETWDRQFTDIFEIQDEIARAVTDALRVELLNEIPAAQRTDPQAYALYLKGREAYFERVEPDAGEAGPQLDEALSLLTHALALDPEYAPAWAQVAWTHFQRGQWMREDPSDVFALAEAAAHRAISIDPANASALTALGAVSDLWHRDSVSAAKWYGKALSVAPRSPLLLNYYRLLFDRHEASAGSLNIAIAVYEYDPLNIRTLLNLALTYWTSGMREAAREHLELARQMQPNANRVLVFDASFAYMEGDFEKAARLSESGHQVIYSCAMHRLGAHEEARSLLKKLRESESPYALSLAEVNACIGEHDRAFEWLQRAYEQRLPMLRNIRTNYYLESLRDDPRWDELVSRVGLSDELIAPMRSFVDEVTLFDHPSRMRND